ncbi:methionyl-tRNA formyltransferase [Duganella sp. BJB488]|uniref:methionyl-tRNA formyltransferase n=1 Tax=unclassified Duganella TaxID=2636909 RepID=UPI000E34876B|nr:MULTISPECIES: methionyl-tRNA formyltransferase [unclassified Duganella]RFP22761.1 methionyl-tRNA formyltransferase [Duganella sp. BJB489]RFP25165.1 methionyl-tRNA formyltransferase [Duganella sp. BJB488]RFP33759.1 methionyl-tRNA formyltransferase [Duganella sp. BJB480]
MKVIFAGTPEFAAVALQALHEAGFEIPLVLTQPDRPAGRGMHLQPSAVKQYALAQGIEVLQPLSLRTDSKDPVRAEQAKEAHARLLSTPYDVMVVAAYGLILPRATLDIKPCLNIHGSLLPRWRGAAPIHRAIEAGDSETGITIMEMEEGLDTGPMLLIERIAIGAQDTTGMVHDKLAALGGKMIVEALRRMQHGQLEAVPQPEAGVCYAAKISKEEAALDFSQSAAEIGRKIRAFNPFPGAHGTVNGVNVKLWGAEVLEADSKAPAGQVLAADAQHGIVVSCGSGSLRLTELQKPGGKRLPAAEFIKGFPLEGLSFA